MKAFFSILLEFEWIVGDFQIEVSQEDVPIDENTYTARAYDINQVMISDFPTSSIVDASTSFISKLIVNEMVEIDFPFI